MNKIFLKNETLLPRRQATQGSMFNYSSFLVPYLYMVYISYGIISPSLYTGTILICVITIH